MADYTDIYGKRVKDFDSDPTLTSSYEGQVWYDKSTGVLKSVIAFDAWSSGSPLTTARYGSGGAGTQTAGLCIGGNIGPGDVRTTVVEEYNGSGWATGGALPAATRSMAAAGTQTAAFSAGGYETSNTAEAYTYDGSSWTAIPALTTARRSLNNMGSGTTTAALVAGGYVEPPYSNASEEYNGSSWSEGNNLNTARSTGGSAGTQTATILAGGTTGSNSAKAEQYDGTSWTEGPNINTARQGLGAAGTQTSAIIVAGRSPDKDATEEWDGSTWSTSPATLATARYDVAPATSGTSSTWMVAGGYGPSSIRNLTEEFNKSINTITAAAWASGGAYPTALLQLGGAGTQTAGLGFGGNGTGGNPNGSVISAEYNGSSWTSSGDLNQKGNTGSRTGVGTQTAALCVARRNDGTPSVSPVSYIAMNNVEEYNGSAWSNSPTLPAATVEAGSTGTTVAALYFGGSPGNPPSGLSGQSLYWNDTSWTATPSLNTSRAGIMSAFQGTYNASLGFGGSTGAPAYGVTNTELYNGSSWTNLAVMLEQKNRGSGHGTSTAALAAAGQNPSTTTNTQSWDGTNWSTSPSTATAQYFQGGGGSSTAAVIFAGADPSNYTTTTQEFTGVTETVTAKTLTTS